MKSTDKPGSVVDSHSSRRMVTHTLKQPTRRLGEPPQHLPIWSCSEWGLACHACYQPCGALLPHLFTLTVCPRTHGGLFSVPLSITSRCPAVNWHSALWSPDFPPRPWVFVQKSNDPCGRGDCLVDFEGYFNTVTGSLLQEYPLNAAVVGFADIVRHPVVPQNVLGNFDHNVVGGGA